MSRVGQVWRQTQSEEDDPEGECELIWVVLSTDLGHGWLRPHDVLILAVSGGNWRKEIKPGRVWAMADWAGMKRVTRVA